MTSQGKFVLKQLLKLTNTSHEMFSFVYDADGEPQYFTLCGSDDPFYFVKFGDEMISIMEYLVDCGFVEKISRSKFRLTHKALHRYRIAFDNFMIFLLKSVIVPIIVSAITSLITITLSTLS